MKKLRTVSDEQKYKENKIKEGVCFNKILHFSGSNCFGTRQYFSLSFFFLNGVPFNFI